MAQSKEKLPLEEGEHELYIHSALWCKGRKAPFIKVELALSPRGKVVTSLYLSLTYYARVWAVRLAEYCRDYNLPWPEFDDTRAIINTFNSLKRERIPLTVNVKHETIEEGFFLNTRLLRPSS